MSKDLTLPEGPDSLSLPAWLGYLLGNYPDSTVNEATFEVLLDQFGGEDVEIMLTAVRRLVSRRVYRSFPKVGEIRQIVDSLRYEQAQGRPSLSLATERAKLLERAYRGEATLSEWRTLYALFIRQGRESGAAAILSKYHKITGEELYPPEGESDAADPVF